MATTIIKWRTIFPVDCDYHVDQEPAALNESQWKCVWNWADAVSIFLLRICVMIPASNIWYSRTIVASCSCVFGFHYSGIEYPRVLLWTPVLAQLLFTDPCQSKIENMRCVRWYCWAGPPRPVRKRRQTAGKSLSILLRNYIIATSPYLPMFRHPLGVYIGEEGAMNVAFIDSPRPSRRALMNSKWRLSNASIVIENWIKQHLFAVFIITACRDDLHSVCKNNYFLSWGKKIGSTYSNGPVFVLENTGMSLWINAAVHWTWLLPTPGSASFFSSFMLLFCTTVLFVATFWSNILL
jgi:hypothetical protein